jgi:oxygen-independent coproporphyrinogen-3 oxidase
VGKREPETEGAGQAKPLGLYVHVPFCSAICNYCNFNRGLFDAALKTRYVAALVCEIETAGAREAAPPPADTIFFGGGTPSLLEPAEIGRVIDAIRANVRLDPAAEITMEANPETVDRPALEAFRAAGVNRLSFGVQSFRDDELARLGRIHDAARARAAVRAAREAGFDNVSLDLMMWLPGQRVDQWLGNVDALIEASPDHASLYLLELYPNAPLKEDMARAGWSLAPDDDAADMYLQAMARLDAAGYIQYEISNVARPGRPSRHNLKYWTDGEWLGFGCGAHSTRAGRRWKNVSATADYVDRVMNGASLVTDARVLTTDDQVEEALVTGLRLTEGVDLPSLRERYGVDAWARWGASLQPFVEAGWLQHARGRLSLTRSGMLLANEILQVFV